MVELHIRSYLITAIALLLPTLLIWRIVNNVFLSPLRSIPGPFLAKLSGKWLVFIDFAGNRTSTIHKLHQNYGSAVRIGPNEVSFSNIASVKEIYGQQTRFLKAPAYDNMSTPPFGVFSLRDRMEHSQRRKLLSHAFSQASLDETEPTIQILIDKLVTRIEASFGKPLNMLLWFRCLSLDIVGELFLGQSFGALESDHPPEYMENVDRTFIDMGLKGAFPSIHMILTYLPIEGVQKLIHASENLREYGKNAFYKYIDSHGRQPERKDLLTKMLTVKPESGTPPLTDLQMYAEVGNLVFAGTDTTSTTLTYLFWELAKHQIWLEKLQDELKTKLAADTHDAPPYHTLAELPVLDAIINETLRLHPAAPASLQRSTPQGGKVIDGYHIPQGTIVSMQCYTTQRDPTVFTDPEAWKPDRWLSGKVSNEMKEMFMPFSKGPRACLGKNMALMELKLTTAVLVMQMKVSMAPDTTDQSMEMQDHFLALPKSGKCDLVFEKA